MRIGIDARMYCEGLGIGRYIQQLISNLEKIEDQNEIIVFLRKKNWDQYTPSNPRFSKILADVPWYSLSEQAFLPRLIRHAKVDLMHYPHFNVPVFCATPYIVTIHDLIMLTAPHSARSAVSTRHPIIHAIKHFGYRFVLKSAIERARNVITVSGTAAHEIAAFAPSAAKRIRIIYEAPGSLPAPQAPVPSSVVKPFVLAVGNAYPHKNLQVLLSVWEKMRIADPSLLLVFCGQEDIFTERLKTAIHERGLDARVMHLGRVSDEVLSSLYSSALCLVTPSLHEGFGLPGLEALAAHTPTLASDIPVYREVLGDAALYCDPTSPDDILEKLITLKKNPPLRTSLIEKGDRRARQFSWSTTATQTRELYHI